MQKPGMIPSVGGREWRGSEVSGFGVSVTFGVTELPCFACLAGCSGFTCITQLGTEAPGGRALGGGRLETSSRAAPGACSEAGTSVLALAVGLGCPAAGKGRGAMEEGVKDCHPQCTNAPALDGAARLGQPACRDGIALGSHRAVPICTDQAGMGGWM